MNSQKGLVPILILAGVLIVVLILYNTNSSNGQIVKDIQTDKNVSYKVTRVEGNFAAGEGTAQGDPLGGFSWLAIKENGKWRIIWTGRQPPLCSDMQKYSVPQAIYKNCI